MDNSKLKKTIMLTCAALLTACSATSEQSTVETYVVTLPMQSTASYFDVYLQNRQQQRNHFITADFIEANYQAVLQLHNEELTNGLIVSFIEKIEIPIPIKGVIFSFTLLSIIKIFELA